MKRCIDCLKNKPHRHYSMRMNGYGNYYPNGACKPCMVKRTQAWVKANRKRWNAYQAWYQRERREELRFE